MGQMCPLCGKDFEAILEHFSVFHEIDSINQLEAEITLAESKEKTKVEYGKFIDEIDGKLNKKEITIEQWKVMRSKWEKEHGM